jgi:alginate O-acetyltransferase complex protein AlgJ
MSGNSMDGAEVRQFSLVRAINRFVLAFVFFGILSLPILWFGRPSFVPALQENRLPTPFPHYSLFWFQQVERWFDDRFGMRDALVYYGSRLQMARTGTPTNQEAVVGRDGWLFYDEHYTPGHPHFADMLGQAPLNEADLRTIAANLEQVRDRLQRCGTPFYLVLAPDKQTVYPEKLWVQAPPGTVTSADQLMRYLTAADPRLRIVDLRNPLRKAKAAQPYELYKRTDTHWNTLGAFVGYQAITARLVQDRVIAASPRSGLDAYRLTREPFDGGDIAVNLLSLPGYFKDYIVRFDPVAPRHAALLTLPGWPAQGVDFELTGNPAATGKLVLFRDSFSGELMPFFAEDFNRMFAVLSHRVDGDVIGRAQPDVVILELVERNLRLLRDAPVNLPLACNR